MSKIIQLPIIPSSVPTHDNTMMSSLSYCERRYVLEHILHKRSPGRSAALGFGGLLHVGLDAIYVSFKANDDAGVPRDVLAAGEAMVAVMEAADFLDPEGDYRTRGRAMKVLIDYLIKFQEDLEFRTLYFTETPFDLTQEDGFRWGGVMDLWVEHSEYGGMWIVDHKRTSRKEKYYFDNFRRDPQMIGYLTAGLELHGKPVQGVIINNLHVLTGSHDFERAPLAFPQWLIDEAKQMQVENYKRIAELREQVHSVPDAFNISIAKPNFYNCVGKYGRCPMYEVCNAQPENREWVVENELEEHEWNWKERED